MYQQHTALGKDDNTVKPLSFGRGYIHGCRVGVHVSKWLFTRQPLKILSQIGYIHGCRMSTYNCYLHGSRSRCQYSVIYTAAVCHHKIAIYTAAVQEPNRLYTRQPGVSIKLFDTRQTFQSKFRYIHGCRVSTLNGYLHGSRSIAKSAI